MHWIALATIISFGWAGYHFFIKLAGEKINPAFGWMVLAGVIFIVSILNFFLQKNKGGELLYSPEGLKYSIFAALAAGLGEGLVFYLYAQPATPLNLAVVFMAVATTLIVFVLSYMFLNETLTTKQLIGAAFGLVSIALLTKP